MSRPLIYLLLLLFSVFFPAAAVAGGDSLSLSDSIKTAIDNNRQLMYANDEVDVSKAMVGKAASSFMPKVDLSYTYSLSDNPVMAFSEKLAQRGFTNQDFINVNHPGSIGNNNYRAQITQPIWNGGREMIGYRRAGIGQEAASSSYLRSKQDVIFKVVQAYYGVALAEENIKTAQEAQDVTRAHLDVAQRFFDQGMLISSELLLAKVRLAEVSELLIKAKNRHATAMAALNMLMNRPMEQEFTLTDRLERTGFDDGYQQLQAEAIASRPDLRGAELNVQLADKSVSDARAGWLPGINIVAHLDYDDSDAFRFRSSSYTLMGVLSWNLFDGLATTSAVAEARARKNAALHMQERMRQAVLFELLQSWNNLQEARARIDVSSSVVSEAGESLGILQKRFQNGLAKTIDVMDAQSALTRASMMRSQAMYDYNVSVAAVKLAAGRIEY